MEDGCGELACVAVDTAYQGEARADALLDHIERRAKHAGLARIFVLTTRTAHWFRERGFEPGKIGALPMGRQALYNYQRNSRVFIKQLSQ